MLHYLRQQTAEQLNNLQNVGKKENKTVDKRIWQQLASTPYLPQPYSHKD